MTIFAKLAEQVKKGNSDVVAQLVKEILAVDITADRILNEGLVAGMTMVGESFKNNECFIPEVLISAQSMKAGMEILEPLLAATGLKSPGKVVIGTIEGDLHDIGKNIAAMLLQGAGFKVVDLGADVPVDTFVASAKKEKADIVGISALLVTTMINMKAVIEGLKKAGIREKVKVIIGGAPVTEDFAGRMGADGYAPDAAAGVDIAKSLLKI